MKPLTRGITIIGLAVLACGGIILLPSVSAFAQETNRAPVLKNGRDVQMNVRNKFLGDDLVGVHTLMKITSKDGQVRERLLNRYVKTYPGMIHKYFIRVLDPPDLRNVGLLTWDNPGEDDTRYLYMPALHKTKRVGSRDRGQSFIGTDFTLEDLGTVPVDDYTYSDTQTVVVDGEECYYYVVTAKPDSSAVYSKINTWTAKKSWVRLKMECFDEKGDLLKVFHAYEITWVEVAGGEGDHKGVWTPHHLTMENVQEKHRTDFFMRKIVYNVGLPEKVFSVANMESMSEDEAVVERMALSKKDAEAK